MLERRFTPGFRDPDAAKAAFVAHNDRVRATAPPDRLLEWRAADGWKPLCRDLAVDVPDEPFPHTNTTEEFVGRHTNDDVSDDSEDLSTAA